MKDEIKLIPTRVYEKNVKELAKKYKSMKDDLKSFKKSLQENPEQGSPLGGGFRKVRMAISSKGKGKSGGARVITLNCLVKKEVDSIILVTIYDKDWQDTITVKEIREALATL